MPPTVVSDVFVSVCEGAVMFSDGLCVAAGRL